MNVWNGYLADYRKHIEKQSYVNRECVYKQCGVIRMKDAKRLPFTNYLPTLLLHHYHHCRHLYCNCSPNHDITISASGDHKTIESYQENDQNTFMMHKPFKYFNRKL